MVKPDFYTDVVIQVKSRSMVAIRPSTLVLLVSLCRGWRRCRRYITRYPALVVAGVMEDAAGEEQEITVDFSGNMKPPGERESM